MEVPKFTRTQARRMKSIYIELNALELKTSTVIGNMIVRMSATGIIDSGKICVYAIGSRTGR